MLQLIFATNRKCITGVIKKGEQMKRIVLLRHGESTWNKDNRFTGWTDVDLTEKGIADANQTGILLKEKGFHFDKAYTSFLKRAVKTLNCVLDKMDQDWIPVEKSWRLNEKHYGALQGLNKSETASKYGEEQVLIWRRSFNVAPNALPEMIRAIRKQIPVIKKFLTKIFHVPNL